jgi:hypothetical protein
MWNKDYCFALNIDDTNLLAKLKSLSVKMVEIEDLYKKECDIKREKREKEREEYEQSEEYKQYLQEEKDRKAKEETDYRQKEDDRLKRCIEKYGEVEGRRFYGRL